MKDPYRDGKLTEKNTGKSARTRKSTGAAKESIRAEDHYAISQGAGRSSLNLSSWLVDGRKDPALQVGVVLSAAAPGSHSIQDFLKKLKENILNHLLHPNDDSSDEQYNEEDRNAVFIANETLHSHQTMTINYTTYDLRRERGTLNMDRNRDFITHSQDAGHPYEYGRIIGIYSATVRYAGRRTRDDRPQRMEFLHVRWFAVVGGGWSVSRPVLLEFHDPSVAFDIIDPSLIIRPMHLIPSFWLGVDEKMLQSATAHPQSEKDYRQYHLN